MVYASEMRYFKVTVSPEDSKTIENPNKFTYIFLYYDGTFIRSTEFARSCATLS